MSETNYAVERNGVTVQLEEAVIGKKSKDNAGKKFLAPNVTMENLDTMILWVGRDQVAAGLNKNLRLVFIDLYLENVKANDGQFDLESFLEDAKDFTAARVTLSDIDDQLDELYTKQSSYAEDPEFGADSERGNELIKLAKEASALIRPLKVKQAELTAEYERRAQIRKTNKAKKDAEAAAAKLQAVTAGSPA